MSVLESPASKKLARRETASCRARGAEGEREEEEETGMVGIEILMIASLLLLFSKD